MLSQKIYSINLSDCSSAEHGIFKSLNPLATVESRLFKIGLGVVNQDNEIYFLFEAPTVNHHQLF